MYTVTRIVLLVATFVCTVCLSRLCGQTTQFLQPHVARPLIVDSRFSSAPVNDRVLLYNRQAPKKQPLPIDLHDFSPNTDPSQVMLGPAYANPQVWIYLPIVNPTSQSRNMVVDMDHNRCDTLDAFLLRGHPQKSINLGRLFRSIPLVQRSIPIRAYALPFTLAPHDSVGLLLRSQRTTGIHELNIIISTEKHFLVKRDEEEIIRLFALSSAFFFTFMVFSLGLIFKHRLLVYFGVFVFPVVLGQLNYNFFFDGFPFPPWLGLNADSIGIFIIFTTNCLFHPFGLEYIKSLTLYNRWHTYAVRALVGSNLIQLLLLLFPLTPLTNSIVTNASLVLVTLNILWLFYTSVLGFIEKREKYLLITTVLVFFPVLYKTYMQQMPALSYTHFQPFYYLLLFGYLIVSLFRRELISRQMTEEKIRLVHGNLEKLRKTEIEQIGRNLHDQLGNTLASAMGYLNMNAPKVEIARALILDAINEARVISHNLVKDDDRPLDEKLEDLAERFDDFSAICFVYNDFTDRKINQLTPLKQQGIYMIVQEVLNNIIKHSQAREATIQAFLSEGLLRVTIEDDGIGYTANHLTSGIGIGNMHKRAELANLKLAIDGGTGGTSVSIETPLAG